MSKETRQKYYIQSVIWFAGCYQGPGFSDAVHKLAVFTWGRVEGSGKNTELGCSLSFFHGVQNLQLT